MSSGFGRTHLGDGDLVLDRQVSVFINCPFDDGYSPLFDAIVFSAICCGFLPRCAIEAGVSSTPRISRIAAAMSASKYSIHDLSRCQGEGSSNLARFNMPLELGMAMTEKFRDKDTSTQHDWLALVPEGHVYKRFVSDLAGYDPAGHNGTVESVVPVVMSWLATRPDAVQVPPPQAVLRALPLFQQARAKLSSDWYGCEPWTDLLLIALNIGRDESLIPVPSVSPAS